MKADYVQHNGRGEPVIEIKHLAHFRGWRLNINRIVNDDPDDCFHSHPAWAIRIILKGGYLEEVYDPDGFDGIGTYKRWTPGMMGIVRPEFTHRIHRLLDGPSTSLWLRGPRTHEIELIGPGWLREHMKMVEEFDD